MGRSGNFSDIPEVVIYKSISLKFTGYLATVRALLHSKFYGDMPIIFELLAIWRFHKKSIIGENNERVQIFFMD